MHKILILLLLSAFSASMQAQPNQFRGSERNGIYPDTGLLDRWPENGPELLAVLEGIGDGYSSPSINEEGVFIAGMIDSIGYIFHFDHQAKLKWKFRYGKEYTFKYTGARGTPTLEEDRLYYSGSYGDAFCLIMQSGEVIWKRNIFDAYEGATSKWGYTESPLLYKNLLILTPGGPDHSVVALNKLSGELEWALDLDTSKNTYNSPVLINHGGEDYILLNTTKLILVIQPETGEVKFSHPIKHSRDMNAISPLYEEGAIFYTTGYGLGSVRLKFNEITGGMDTLYLNRDLDCRLSGLISYEGLVFGTSDRKKQWVGVDLESGQTLFTSRDVKPGSFLLADDKFFIFTEMGEVVLAVPDKEGFSVVSRFPLPVQSAMYAFAHPVLHDGILYIRYREHLWLYKVNYD